MLPSVTQILMMAGLIDTSFMRRSAAARGTKVHEATAQLDRGEKGFADLDHSIGAYVVGWRMWVQMEQVEILEVEKIVGGAELGFAGTCDRVIRRDGDTWVLDLKTGASRSWHRLQLAAYALALGIPCRRMALYLDDCCRARSREFSAAEDLEEFLRLLDSVSPWWEGRRRYA